MTRLLFYALAVLLLIVTLHACDLFEAENPYPEGKASVRVVHVAPMASSVNYFHMEEVLFSNLNFGEATEYVDIPVGRNPDGFLSPDGDTLVARTSVSSNFLSMRFFDFERNFTIYAIHGPAGSGHVHIRSMEVEPTPNAGGNVRMRVLHAVPEVEEVDIYLTEPGAAISATNIFAFDIGFNNEGGSANSLPAEMPLYQVAQPGTHEVKVTLAEDNDVIFTQEVELGASRNYTMVLVPTAEGDAIDRVMMLADN